MSSDDEKDFHAWMELTRSRHQLHKNAKAQKEQVIAFLEEPGGTFPNMMNSVRDLVDKKAPIDLATFEEQFGRVKTTKNLSLISENVSSLDFEICNDEKPQKVYDSLVQLLTKSSSATITSGPSTPTKPGSIGTKDQLQKH